MKNILIIAAENSAENYGAQIIDEFQKHNAPVNFFGVGGDKFLARGADVIIHNKELAVVGIIEVISSITKLKRCMTTLVKIALKRKTDAAILIDYPDFNIRIAKKLKRAGIPVYYYISPTVWAWRYSRVRLLKKYVTHMFIIFPFEIPIFEKEGIPFTYIGHPLLPMIKVNETRESFKARMGIYKKEKNEPGIMVTLLPGSRNSEVHFLLPEMLKAMELLKKEFNITLFLLKAAGIEQESIAGFLKESPLDVMVIPQEQGYDLIHASDIVLTTCGTSNLEIAILGTPFVAVYRVNRLSYLLGKSFVKIDLYSIVNILAQKEVIKELIQHHFTAENIVKEMRHILTNQAVREKMLAEFVRIREMLSQDQYAPEIIYNNISADIFGPRTCEHKERHNPNTDFGGSQIMMRNPIDMQNLTGLSEAEVADRLKNEGFNELPLDGQRNILAIAFEIIKEPMFLMLIACGILYLILGDIKEAMMLMGFVFIVIGITLYQERKTERALEALRDLSSPRALVIRDGKERRIAGREVVRGDILVVSEGDRVPADAVILACVNLSTDESLLTGESVSVRKTAAAGYIDKMDRPGGDDIPFIFSSTLVVQGQGVARVLATGINTEIGKIGKALQMVETEETLLQKGTSRMVRNLSIVGLSLCALVIIIYGLTRGDWLHGFLAGIALAMATLPEELPVVLTIFLALGAWRISQKNVLTRRMPAIETLGSATVLCVDKTGTLTMNRMSVSKIFTHGEFYDIDLSIHTPLPETFHELVEFSILASQIDPFDPMEKAIKQLGEHYLAQTEHLHANWSLVHEYPLSKKLLSLSRVWEATDGKDYVIAAKGAPEAIADLCHFGENQVKELLVSVGAMADNGLRVLGVARADFARTILPGQQHDFEFQFLGLIGLADPVRAAVPAAINECYNAGIRVMMITGDYPGTAQNIGRQIGLKSTDKFITGPELDNIDDAELQHRIKDINIFARVVPEQKLRIVKALKANNEIVAMTGDGVNDAPALKSAHIGIAMGERGTDVARESAALVLLDDDFSSIVQAVRLGRRIFDNIKKAIAYIFAIHVPIAGISLIPVLLKWPLVLMPVHIMFLELIIDPACSTVFEAEPEERNVMKRRPRNPKEPLFSKRMVGMSLLQGANVLILCLAVFAIAYYRGLGDMEARAMTFTTLIIANLSLILTNRSWSRTILATLKNRNAALWWVLGGAFLFLSLALYVPVLRVLFRFAVLHPMDLAICLIVGSSSILWFELLKHLHGRKK